LSQHATNKDEKNKFVTHLAGTVFQSLNMKVMKPKLCSRIKPLSISSEKCTEEWSKFWGAPIRMHMFRRYAAHNQVHVLCALSKQKILGPLVFAERIVNGVF